MPFIRRFGRWCDAGVFEKLHDHFHEAGDFSALLIDSTIVRAHSSAAGAPKKKRRSAIRKPSVGVAVALPRKLNAAVNDAFLPLRFTLTAGACHDVTQAPCVDDRLHLPIRYCRCRL